ncbi:protein of unknown function [Candidatus Nitrosocosmicus franklandus]|uniref:Uncharacterized protein n=1 Tax=Candidatus Nitrosocosmicus franklandianus TaxID=1798806 RepID=A0A484I8Y3_9ARCH|nr:protein of unknown function [Candidatus Nitrosocosmicus franklandus]
MNFTEDSNSMQFIERELKRIKELYCLLEIFIVIKKSQN